MSKHLKKLHDINLWLVQHDALCDQNYVWCDPHTVSWPTQGLCGMVDWVELGPLEKYDDPTPHIEKLVVFK